MGDRARLRNMASVYLLREDRVLLLYRKGSRVVNDVWVGSAGGHFEECEVNDAERCALRELQEELSVTQDMISGLRLRYITIRRTKGEIRQNYYFFAELSGDCTPELVSNEGTLKWFKISEISELKMPFSAKHMLEHYLAEGMENDKIYVGAADGEKLVFTPLPEF